MKIIVGLGNPGKEYEKTKHNLGFLFLEYLENKYKFSIIKNAFDAVIYETTFEGEKVVFVKPQTYMNLSGNSVVKVKNFYRVEPKDIIVIFDDIDIPFGTIKYKTTGSGGTHNGMKNIVTCLNTKEFSRIKIGIGGLKHENQDLKDFVLQRFNKEQLLKLEEIFESAELKLKEFIRQKDK